MSIIDPIRTRVDLAQLDLGFGEFPNAQPFSPRSAIGYQDLLETLYRYVTRDVFLALTQTSGQATWDANVDLLITAIDTALGQQKSDIDAEVEEALQQLINSTIAVTDPVVLALITNLTSQTRTTLDGLYFHNTPAHKNAVTGYYHCEAYGAAVGNTGHANTAAMQAAIDAAAADYALSGVGQKVWFGPGVFPVDVVDYHNADGSTAGVVSLMLRDGVTIDGIGALKVVSGAYGPGAQFRVIGSKNTGISHAGVKNITIDGNRGALPGNNQASNIVIIGLDDITVTGVKSINPNGVGIMVRSPAAGTVMTRVQIKNNTVQNGSAEGIQCSAVRNAQIQDNIVTTCAGNGIDVYNENGTATPDGGNIDVSGNIIESCGNGIFIETCKHVTVTRNNVDSCADTSIWVNRINGAPSGIIVADNQLRYSPTGVKVLGDTAGVIIHSNFMYGQSSAGVRLGQGGNVGAVDVRDNWIDTADDGSHPHILIDGAAATHIRVRGTRTNNGNTTFWVINSAQSSYDVVIDQPSMNS